ncbi:hypothetical protein [Croceibacterium aestuarii]|uniref:hypothetical protein n=1 Tax=Croceibacterium aestuarii TaxID=3064139 RepID=UPI00272DDBBB|nr:hypothetical protein [Croceibacterium sp. D39]
MERGFSLRTTATAGVAALLLHAVPAHAGGVAAGTLIENTATASFSANGASRTVNSNTVSITVDEVIDVAVASQDGAPIPSAGATTLRFLVTNSGNGPESYKLTVDPGVAGNDFDLQIDKLAIDTNGNGVYDEGVDTLLASGAATPALDPDGSLNILVVGTVPAGAADGGSSKVKLLAQAATGSGTPGTVFSGAGADGVDAVAGLSGADDDDAGEIVASLASVSLTKSATVADPFGGTQPVPGAIITYTIAAAVAGSGSATGLRVSDTFPTSTTYVANSLTLDGSALTDGTDSDAGEASVTGIGVDLGDLAAGTTRTVSFRVTIEN